MSNYTCVEGTTLKFKFSTPPITGSVIVDNLASTYSSKVKHQGKRAIQRMVFQITGATNGTCTQTLPVIGFIQANSEKNKSGGVGFVLDNIESGIVTIVGVTGSSSPCSFKTTIQISNPANDKVKMV